MNSILKCIGDVKKKKNQRESIEKKNICNTGYE